ncbi:MAG: cytochrome b/b6 domain-containing protein [Paracoccaceae bacterium]
MSATNTARSYGTVTKAFHWSIALLIPTAIALGVIAHRTAYAIETDPALAGRAALLFSLHKTVGMTILAVALARIAWAVTQTKPGPIHPERGAETLAASVVHWLLYGSLVLVPLTGWITHAATSGFAPIWWPFPQTLPFVPRSEAVAGTFATLHMIFERVMVAALLLHVLGALKHHLWDRDATLRRMWFGRTLTDTRAHRAPLAAPVIALAVWGLAVGGGAAAGMLAGPEARAATAQLSAVSSDWQVEEGTLSIAVRQFGSTVEGSFADWTAAIAFDETVESGEAGTVTVEIATGSLTLGSVTDQALGPEYFDAGRFPVARYDAVIHADAGTYEARGTLSLRGADVPVTLPFELSLDGTRATMSGTAILDRRDFDIGAQTTDEATLGFPVEVAVALTAVRE